MTADFKNIPTTNISYVVGEKTFLAKDDFTFGELDWLDVIYNKLNVAASNNEITGNYTREDIKKTIKILLAGFDGSEFTDEDFMRLRESQVCKIIADFFLKKALSGVITNRLSMN